jgi:hypothetical protein
MNEKYEVSGLKRAHEEYIKREGRHGFYDMALKLMRDGYVTEARILLLYGWNSAWLAKLSINFNLEIFEKTLEDCKPYFDKLRGKNLLGIRLKDYEAEIKAIFVKLSSINEIKYTGASKLLSLEISDLFVMWDEGIRGSLDADGKTPEGYYHFLEKTQEMVKGIVWISEECDNITLAKAIDEYNYMCVLNERERSKKTQKRVEI